MALRNLARRPALLLPAAILLSLALSACAKDRPQSTFDTHGPVALTQLHLFWWIFLFAVLVFILVEGLLIYTLVRYRRKPTDTALPEQVHGNSKLEVVWTLLPVVILTALAVPTYITIANQRNPPPDPNTINVEVVGHQWWWEFRYTDLGITTANELHMPVNTVVSFVVHSDDVIHSFWVPKLGGKVDVIPAHDNVLWLKAADVGNYYGQCAEFCGLQHAKMRFRAIAETQADWEKWVSGQQGAPAPVPANSLAAKGQTLFNTKQCSLCHTVTGPDAKGLQQSRQNAFIIGSKTYPGPNLTFFAERGTFAGGTEERTAANVHSWIANPDSLKKGTRMGELAAAYNDPNDALSASDVDALVAFLESRTFATGR